MKIEKEKVQIKDDKAKLLLSNIDADELSPNCLLHLNDVLTNCNNIPSTSNKYLSHISTTSLANNNSKLKNLITSNLNVYDNAANSNTPNLQKTFMTNSSDLLQSNIYLNTVITPKDKLKVFVVIFILRKHKSLVNLVE